MVFVAKLPKMGNKCRIKINLVGIKKIGVGMIKNRQKSAMITVELAIGIALSLAVLFVVLGLFNDNLRTMVANSNFSNIFEKNDSKITYSSFDKNYSGSQINVQIMGEQGLQMLRKKANNLAITLIESPFNNSNSNGTTIKYLSSAIRTIVGNGNICVYMKKDSDKLCSDTEIGGYSYNVNSGSASSLTVQKVDTTGHNVLASVSIPLSTSVNNAVDYTGNIPTTNPSYTSSLTVDQKYSALQTLTDTFKPYIDSNATLVTEVNPKLTSALGVATLKAEINTLLEQVRGSAQYAYNRCIDHEGDRSLNCSPFVDNDDFSRINNWITQLKSTINSDATTSKSTIAYTISSSFNQNSSVYRNESGTRAFRLAYDRKDGKSVACETLINGLVKIAQKYDLKISDFGISESSNNYSVLSGEYACKASK